MNERSSWQPRVIRRVVAFKPTRTEAAEVVTDLGGAFAKFRGNLEGPHALAAEFVGTRLAGAMGLPIFDWRVIDYDGVPEIRLPSGATAQAGSAWLTRKVEGMVWSGKAKDVKLIENRADVAKLILFDQWTLNCDRYRPTPPPVRKNLHNVFFSRESAVPGKLKLLAMDHTHILTCGSPFRPDMARQDRVRNTTAYGLFPAFQELIDKGWIRREDAVAAVASMNSVELATIRAIVREIPRDWEVDDDVRIALIDFLQDRRNWLSPRFVPSLFPQGELLF